MREIKFRAYHSGRMWKPFNLKWFKDKNKTPEDWEDTGILEGGKWPEKTIFLQYTGLKDKNGKEIWEEDICKVLFGDQELIYVCSWYDEIGAWVFRGNGEWLMWEDVFETCEIIGNKREHPNLLEDK